MQRLNFKMLLKNPNKLKMNLIWVRKSGVMTGHILQIKEKAIFDGGLE